ncbi:MAG TPA: diacylglycerol kinase family protein [bacterium]|nr:diacylglycerol kinase family protein [bacterium]HPL95713.1 diacylglycerol kinase family protein [bacterium]
MYYYIYDQFLSQKKYDKVLAQIESKITDLDIKDRIIKISILKSVKELVADALNKGANTIIAVGNDQTINQVVNLVVGHEVVVGIIPVDKKNNAIANFLGINDPLQACEIISARKIEPINLGVINSKEYFINSIQVLDSKIKLECDHQFTIGLKNERQVINIYNFLPQELCAKLNDKKTSPQDNFLEVVIQTKEKDNLNFLNNFFKKEKNEELGGFFRVKNILIKNNSLEKNGAIIIDNFKNIKPPVEIKISQKKIKMIVSKDRDF